MTTPICLPVWLNGRLLPAGQARIDPADRGFLLGDGLFETMRVSGGQVRHFDRHMRRLEEGAATLMLPAPDPALIAGAVAEMLAACHLMGGSLRLTCTRGTGPRGLLPPPEVTPTLLLTASSAIAPQGPVRLVTSIHRRDEESVLSRVKSLNYLPSILARMEAAGQGADDALLLNRGGYVAETCASTLIACIDGQPVTPPVSDGALPGTARGVLVDAGLLHVRRLTPDMLRGAGALFTLNSLCMREVLMLDGHEIPRRPDLLAAMRAAVQP
ncbi:2-keto-4-methylthiobutyrate aminotransferase [Komagataeibacter melaceti]|uniref:Probable branched-chain-amino-acid aminotransferase n=1 Tax=Komagataeibacter melaceti TaxID=2766577 RepID=A0A371Z2Z8_9PROT|nr:aminotransferase class IV [Komagataeibacter melaceti]RFD20872.1 2-keto-4-methylthiobutyrate aminotransferase [Komagataeibacter melaceti]